MSTIPQDVKPTHLLLWIACVAVILFSVAGIAAIMGWIPTSMGHSGDSTEIIQSGIQSGIQSDKFPANATNPVATKTQESAVSHAAPTHVADNTVERTDCAECGVIESTREVTSKGEGSGIGAVGGAVVGGLLGNQVGAGRGNTVATALGAVGGAVAGNEVEKRVKTSKSYNITVRLDDGSSRVIREAKPTAWRTGDHVKIVGNVIHANP